MIFRFLSKSRVRKRESVQIVAHSHKDFFLINNQTHPFLAKYSYYIHISAMGRRVRECAQHGCVCVAEKRRLFLSFSYISILPSSLCCSFVSNLEHHPLQHRSIAVLPLPFDLLHLYTCIHSFEHTRSSSTPNNHAVSSHFSHPAL